MWALSLIQRDWWCAAYIIETVHPRVECEPVLIRKPKVFRRSGELVDEVSEVGVVEVHEFVDVSKTEGTAAIGWWRRWRLCATENMSKGIEEM